MFERTLIGLRQSKPPDSLTDARNPPGTKWKRFVRPIHLMCY